MLPDLVPVVETGEAIDDSLLAPPPVAGPLGSGSDEA
jgi:hypothetical protein